MTQTSPILTLSPRLGEMLIVANLANNQDVQRAIEFQNQFGGSCK